MVDQRSKPLFTLFTFIQEAQLPQRKSVAVSSNSCSRSANGIYNISLTLFPSSMQTTPDAFYSSSIHHQTKNKIT